MEEEEEGKEEEEEDDEPSSPAWMATFGDLMSLLLTFFVLIVAFTDFDNVKVMKLNKSFSDSLQIFSSGSESFVMRLFYDPLKPGIPFHGSGSEDKTLKKDEETMEKNSAKIMGDIVVAFKKGSDVSLSDQKASEFPGFPVFFYKGDDRLTEESLTLVKRVSSMFKPLPYELKIVGYSDEPISHLKSLEEQWEMASERSLAVCQIFIDNGIPPQRVSIGVASHLPVELLENTATEPVGAYIVVTDSERS